MRVLGVIPARLASTRLPRKVLRELAGLPLVIHTYRSAQQARTLSDLLIATDDEEVARVCRAHQAPVVMTSAAHPSGTDRVWEVAQTHDAEVYVNIQGDEPFVTAGHIDGLVAPFAEPEVQVTTLKILMRPEEVPTRTANKVVTSVRGDALYFSRLPIPFDRDDRGDVVYWKHPGFYAYRRSALEAFHRLPPLEPGARGGPGAAPLPGERHPHPRGRDHRADDRGGHRGRPACRRGTAALTGGELTLPRRGARLTRRGAPAR